MSTGAIAILFVIVVGAGLLFVLVRMAVRMAIRLALAFVLLVVVLGGALAAWWYTADDTAPRPKPSASPARPTRTR